MNVTPVVIIAQGIGHVEGRLAPVPDRCDIRMGPEPILGNTIYVQGRRRLKRKVSEAEGEKKGWPVTHPEELQSGLIQSELELCPENVNPVIQKQHRVIERVGEDDGGDYIASIVRQVEK